MPYIKISNAMYEELFDYAHKAELPIEQAANDALDEWMEIFGVSVMAHFARKKKSENQRKKNCQP
jgi:hypothetical protein